MGRGHPVVAKPGSIGPGARRHRAQLTDSKPAYKVVLEQVTQQKKKLITVVLGNVVSTLMLVSL